MTSRRRFIESHGANCRNWRWSWSFVNYNARLIISGAWDRHWSGRYYTVLDDRWRVDPKTGRQRPGYSEMMDYLRLVRDHSYRLKIFDMEHMLIDPAQPLGRARIVDFNPILIDARLEQRDNVWFAIPLEGISGKKVGATP